MPGFHFSQLVRHALITGALLWGAAPLKAADPLPLPQVVISVADQKMSILREGETVASYPISTSRFGLGDAPRSYRTPLGHFRISGKVGENLPKGAVLKGRRFTGEVLPINAPGRDPIVTRILQLEGLEPHNRRAQQRGIYIHGTPEERNIGRPVSFGCIRMRSRDVVDLFQKVAVGTPVLITTHSSRRIARLLAREGASYREIVTTTAPTQRRQKTTKQEVAASSVEKKSGQFSWEWKF